MNKNEITGVILAAGNSTRFGSNKCLKKLPNGHEIGLQAALNLRKHLEQVICVIPSQNPEIKYLFENAGFVTIENPLSQQEGMSSSIKIAIEETKSSKGWLMCLADMPNIKPSSYKKIIAELIQSDGIVIPSVNLKQGNPVGISACFYEQLMAIQGDVGARKIFKNNQSSIQTVEVNDLGILQDIDTRSDYLKYIK